MSYRVYIAGPYTKGDQIMNIRAAIDAGERVAQAGHFPFIPHMNGLWHLAHAHDFKFWMEQDQEWLTQCDCLIRLPGESPGADTEVFLADRHGLKIYEGVQEFIESLEQPV